MWYGEFSSAIEWRNLIFKESSKLLTARETWKKNCLMLQSVPCPLMAWHRWMLEYQQADWWKCWFSYHDDATKWKYLHVTDPLGRESTGHRWIPPHTGKWRNPLTFWLIYEWTNGLANNPGNGYLRRHRTHYDVNVMLCTYRVPTLECWWNICVVWYRPTLSIFFRVTSLAITKNMEADPVNLIIPFYM